ncbi:histidine kinase [Aquimarina sp. MMG016]|uniref:sensor histidine kinase n=1 Tax=Aquimarina sp. MMG016 TaxID=2822690 RepID=UPI001B3A185E|nr:histidine kinase [Aquimarina sp. MMG016]MBQ4821691.1 histidine kinase [Aquimarina sp. MMG016]
MNTILSKHKWSIIFWTVQILGWGGLLLFSFLVTPNTNGYRYSDTNIMGMIASFVAGTFTTGLLRLYLKRVIIFSEFDFKQLIKFVFSATLASFLYFFITFGTGFIMGYTDTSHSQVKVPEILDVGIAFIIFSSFIVIFGWSILYMVIKIIINLSADQLEKSKLNASLKQAKLNTLKSQINPHFMFNSLNNIRGLMLEDVDKSREMLTKLSEMLRYSLTKNDVNAISLEEELEMVDNYIDLSKIQFEDRLEYRKDIHPETLTIPIPPMIIQLLVENGIKHGISNLKSGGKIVVKTKLIEGILLIKVINSGILSISKNTTRLGLQNIQQRLQLLYGNKASFSLNEIESEVVADIKIPIAHDKH